MTIYDFTKSKDKRQWRIIDDVVMGGRSNGSFKVNTDGHGVFYGTVSLENNGGFSSVRYNFESIESTEYNSFLLRIKGDGKSYQFRVKDSRYHRYSYIYTFETSGQWQTIKIPFNQMYPSFRGYRLDAPNFEGQNMEEIAFLIGNKKAENFNLLIDFIKLK